MTIGTDESPTLKERQAALTRQLILEAALGQLEDDPAAPLTVRAVAQRATVAERTVFRYFATREDLLEAVTAETARRLQLPPLPDSAEALPETPRAMYRAFEAQANLTRAALQSELYDRMRESVARDRWRKVKALVDAYAPSRSERERTLAAANIRYMLSASTWRYYRSYFGFSLRESIAAAELAIRQALEGLQDR